MYLGAPSFSPDGKRFAIQVTDGAAGDIWLYNSADGSRSRLTFSSNYRSSNRICWSPDGTRIVFSSNRTGPFQLYLRDTTGSGNDELLFASKNWCYSNDWSRDNRYIIFSDINPKTNFDLWILQLADKKATPFLVTDANEGDAKLSPDGKWIAYCSDESGHPEIYVQPFLGERKGKWQVSTNGGFSPKWSKDGKELFFLSPDNRIMSSAVTLEPGFEAAVPTALFAIHPFTSPRISGGWSDIFEQTPDGKRFAVHAASPSALNITVIQNWQHLLNQKLR
jgi:Tol biopolymer transport system component